jgi:hypothetical protein
MVLIHIKIEIEFNWKAVEKIKDPTTTETEWSLTILSCTGKSKESKAVP